MWSKWTKGKRCIVRCEVLGLEWGIDGMFEEGEWLGGGEVGKERIRGGWVRVYVAAFGAYNSVVCSVGEGQCEIHGSAVRMMGKG
jgi:hypothetical protein